MRNQKRGLVARHGLLPPVDQWNKGKQSEYAERRVYQIPEIVMPQVATLPIADTNQSESVTNLPIA